MSLIGVHRYGISPRDRASSGFGPARMRQVWNHPSSGSLKGEAALAFLLKAHTGSGQLEWYHGG
ncbi:hypothetical protein [Paenibacillus sp. KS-LC4]|uniref:hypothetical protein n=1 Tax=Paenibacillus sp. KS-LC4 TaxID=2979727 RepID=UPI0030CD6451